MKAAKKIYFYFNNIFWLSATYLLTPFFYLLIFFRKKSSKKPRRILVIQTAKIGDLVCSTPVFREIKRHYPQSYLAALIISQTKDILINNPYLDEIILFDKGVLKLIKEIRGKAFDWSFSLVPGIFNTIIPFWSVIPYRASAFSKYDSRGVKILSTFNNYRLEYHKNILALRYYLNLLKFINIKEFSEEKEIFIGLKEKEKALQFLEEHNFEQEDFLIGISATAGKKFKEWAPEKFAQLADKLIKNINAKIIFTGSSKDEVIIKRIQSLMKNKSIKATGFNLIELAALLKEMSLFISVDTGPLYIADTVKTPVIDIAAGSCEMKSQRPSGKFVIVQKPIVCGPCSFVMSAPNYCREGHLKCIRDIEVDDVFQAVKKILAEL